MTLTGFPFDIPVLNPYIDQYNLNLPGVFIRKGSFMRFY